MKNKLLIIIILLCAIGVGVGTALVLYNYKQDTTKIYSCSYIKTEEEYAYTYYSTEQTEDENYECTEVKKINCKDCSIWGYDSGVEYNNSKLLLLHNSLKKEVYIYNTENFELYDTIENVYQDSEIFQRDESKTYLYDNSNVIGLIFPDKENNEMLYMLKNKEIIKITEEQEFYRNTNATYYSSMKEDDTVISKSKYINTANDGAIQVKGKGYQYGVYDLYNKKMLIPFAEGHFLNTDEGFIRYNQNTFVVTYYNKEGKKIFSSEETDSFKYNNPWILSIIKEDLVLIIDITEYDGLVFINNKGEILGKIPLTMKTLKKDFLKEISNDEIKSKLNFDNRIPAYYGSSFYDEETGNITIYFSYSNSYYNANAYIGYKIDLKNNTATFITEQK